MPEKQPTVVEVTLNQAGPDGLPVQHCHVFDDRPNISDHDGRLVIATEYDVVKYAPGAWALYARRRADTRGSRVDDGRPVARVCISDEEALSALHRIEDSVAILVKSQVAPKLYPSRRSVAVGVHPWLENVESAEKRVKDAREQQMLATQESAEAERALATLRAKKGGAA